MPGRSLETIRWNPFTKGHRLPIWLFKLVIVTSLAMGGIVIYGGEFRLAAQEVSTHIVQPGETLSSIAGRYAVSVNALARHNGITNLNLVRVGQVLRIPAAVNTANPPRVAALPSVQAALPAEPPSQSSSTTAWHYTVQRGDTLFSLAARFGVTAAAIKERNRLKTNTILVGQRLFIPR
jgi:peptidoglycan-N-acetylglucosamine deacetylase